MYKGKGCFFVFFIFIFFLKYDQVQYFELFCSEESCLIVVKYEILVLIETVMVMHFAVIVQRDVGGFALEGIKVSKWVN